MIPGMKNDRKPLTYFWPFCSYDKRVQESLLRSFAEAGADRVCLNPTEMGP